MVSCVAKGCTSRSDVHSKAINITFHRIPRDEVIAEKWIKSLGRARICISKTSRVCSKHFTADNFYTNKGLKRLLKTAVPNLDLPHLSNNDQQKVPTVNLSKPKPTVQTHSSNKDDQQKVTSVNASRPIVKAEVEEYDDIQKGTSVNVSTPTVKTEVEEYDDIQKGTSVYVSRPTVKAKVEVYTHRTKSNINKPERSNSTDDEGQETTPLEKKLKRQMKTLQLLCRKRFATIKSLRDKNKRLESKVITLIKELEEIKVKQIHMT